MKVGAEYYFYQNDHLGTPQKMTAMNGAVVWRAKYSSFGKASIEVEAVENNLRFPGQYFDQETGMHYNWHRYYDPGIGRYLRADPSLSLYPEEIGIPYSIKYYLSKPQGLNKYSYVRNNPDSSKDPFGLKDMIDIYRYYHRQPGYGKPKKKAKCIRCDWEALGNCIGISDAEACAECSASGDFYACRKCEAAFITIAVCHYIHCNIVDCCDEYAN